MRPYWTFIKSNYRPVYFGWLLNFFSSFGQTFLISLFVPSILQEFGLSRTAFGACYSAATLLASLFLFRLGDVIDHQPLRPYTRNTVLLLAGSYVLLSGTIHPAMLFLALAGMRLGGQSLMAHISSSVMSRHFQRHRGKALSFSALGFPSGEIIFPLLLGTLLSLAGWRITASASALLLTAVMLPLLKKINIEVLDNNIGKEQQCQQGGQNKAAFCRQVVQTRTFWIIGLPLSFMSLSLTGLHFYQYLLAEERQWAMEWYALCFAAFGLARLVFSLYGGILVDRFGARRLFPFFLIPAMFGFVVIALITHRAAPIIFLPLLGITTGLTSVVFSAVIAEHYGTENIGRIRSIFTVLLVVSAAAGPVCYGVLLDAGHSFRLIGLASSSIIFLLTLNNIMFEGELV